jgi:hypothetical protein
MGKQVKASTSTSTAKVPYTKTSPPPASIPKKSSPPTTASSTPQPSRKDASAVELENDLNLSFLVKDALNTYSDGSCCDGVCCSMFFNGTEYGVYIFEGNSKDAEVAAAGLCHISVKNPLKLKHYHHTDYQPIINQSQWANREAVKLLMLGQLIHAVNYLKRIGHPKNYSAILLEYLRIFKFLDTESRRHAREFLAGTYKTIVVPKTIDIPAEVDISNGLLICRRISSKGDVNCICRLQNQQIRIVLFKGKPPLNLIEPHIVQHGTIYLNGCNGSTAEVKKLVTFVEDMTVHYLRNYLGGIPLQVDLSNTCTSSVRLLKQ